MKSGRNTLALFLIIFCATALAAQQGAGVTHKTSVFELLTASEGASLTLETDFTTLRENRSNDQRFPGVLTSADGSTYRVDLKTRGLFRRKKGEIPPLKIKFSKKDLRAVGLDTMNEIKLVVPFTTDKKGDELVIREYLAYRMLERLTPYSVRARLVQLTLKDSHAGGQYRMFCIVLEDKEETLARLNGTLIESYGLPRDQYDAQQLALMGMFQYMIGNTDWNMGTYHNVRLVRIASQDKIITIPYDFDFAGLVNAPYAVPAVESGKLSVRDRFFMIEGLAENDVNAAMQKILAARADLTELCRSPYLSNRAVKDMVGYLDRFFENMPTCGEIPCALENAPENSWSVYRD